MLSTVSSSLLYCTVLYCRLILLVFQYRTFPSIVCTDEGTAAASKAAVAAAAAEESPLLSGKKRSRSADEEEEDSKTMTPRKQLKSANAANATETPEEGSCSSSAGGGGKPTQQQQQQQPPPYGRPMPGFWGGQPGYYPSPQYAHPAMFMGGGRPPFPPFGMYNPMQMMQQQQMQMQSPAPKNGPGESDDNKEKTPDESATDASSPSKREATTSAAGTPASPTSTTDNNTGTAPTPQQQPMTGGMPPFYPHPMMMMMMMPGSSPGGSSGGGMPMFFPPHPYANFRGPHPHAHHPPPHWSGPPRVAGINLAMACDVEQLSEYQILVRQQLELFQAGPEDVECNTQGRKKRVVAGQVGIRCRHCAGFPIRARGRGAVYYPAKLAGIYQAAQNMAASHLCEACQNIPDALKIDIRVLRQQRDNASGGKQYWADGCRALGLYEMEEGLRIKPPSPPGTS